LLQSSAKQIARTLPDPAKAEEMVAKLLELKDNHIFRSLAQLTQPGAHARPPCVISLHMRR
jgi:hypothetical protein